MENIYTQAVADAKAVRESAMANAKAAIQEAFEPKIKAMLRKHIVENEEMYGQKQEGLEDYSDPISAVKELDIPQNVKLSYLKKNYPQVAGMITKLQTAGDMEPYEILELALGKIGPEETKNVYAYFESQESNFPGGEEDYMEEGIDDYSDPAVGVVELDVPQNLKLSYLVDTYPQLKNVIKKMVSNIDMEPYEIVEFITGKLKPSDLEKVYNHFEPLEGTFEGQGEEDFDGELRSKLGLSSEMKEEYNEYEETMSPNNEATPNELDETTLDEILAELDGLEEAETDLEEAYELNEAEEEEEEETEEDEDGEEESEESTEETKVVDITLGDLVDAIKAAMASETPAPEMGGEEMPADDDISLDEILAELEDEMEEAAAGSGDYMDEAKKKAKDKEEKEKKAEKELKEAKKAIETMRAELNEVNLLNAKLLYVNKIFKSKSLTEAQKVKVLNAFDKATTVKEVKNTYSIISESMTAAPKKQLKESYGFASKPAGVAPKANTVESDPFIARMQKLAGL
jgi:hypothetical protein